MTGKTEIEITRETINKVIRDGLPTTTQDNVEGKEIDYRSMDTEYWIYLINTLKV